MLWATPEAVPQAVTMVVEVVWAMAIMERVISLAVRTGEMKWR